jgi:mannosyltransferase
MQRPSLAVSVGVVSTAVAALYTHYSYPATLVALNWGIALWLVQRLWQKQTVLKPALHWAGLMGVSLLLYLPWLPIFLRGTGGRAPADIPLGEFLGSAFNWLILGSTGGSDQRAVAVVWLFMAASLLPLWLLRQSLTRRNDDPSWLLWLWLLLPLGLMALVGATAEGYHKFMTGLVPGMWLLTAVGVSKLWRTAPASDRWVVPRDPSHLAYSIMYVLSLFTLSYLAPPLWQSLQNLYSNPAYARADYRGMAAQIMAENHPNAAILLNAPNQWEVFTYYYKGDAPVHPLAQNQLNAATAAAELAPIAQEHDRLYALFWGEAERDPERLIERWLDAHAFKAVDEWRGDVRFVMYAVPPENTAVPQHILDLPFGEQITLHGYALNLPAQPQAGDIVQLSLFWQTAQPLTKRYKVFLHLLDESGELVTQRDSEPVGNLKPTDSWQPGELVADNHGLWLPPELPPGEYALWLGLYDLGNPAERLPIGTAGETAWRLGTVRLDD